MIPNATTAADAAVLETFVVPRYLSLFAEPLLAAVIPADGASVAHLGCRTGYPHAELAERLPLSEILGFDASATAIDLARAKSHVVQTARLEYAVASEVEVPLPDRSVSHVIAIHPSASGPDDRRRLFAEAARLLAPSGQALFAFPLRGSFQEVIDLVREYALKHDAGEIGRAAEQAALLRPTVESLAAELEAAGFADVEVSLERAGLEFGSGRDFFEDPVTRLLVLPDVKAHMPEIDLTAALRYVREAIDKYWSEEPFDLTINVGVASARRY